MRVHRLRMARLATPRETQPFRGILLTEYAERPKMPVSASISPSPPSTPAPLRLHALQIAQCPVPFPRC
jgi:hypothetical protein